MAEFDIQTFLSEMRREQTDQNKRIEDKVDAILTTTADHETRLALIEVVPIAEHGTRLAKVEGVIRQIKYVVVTVVGSTIIGFVSLMINRISGGLSK